eukprot:TRINITY_DN1679_c0_g1_i1.p1 TRINITY_DN1679_c0_g1~~TRINITY_DN1679_c0_g1_i1.p1  ORF type:complete len:376 (+),score=87.02 TRINITY_DN1679_c0_g1_i1:77-1129(+)
MAGFSISGELKELIALRKGGELTDQEYAELKAAAIAKAKSHAAPTAPAPTPAPAAQDEKWDDESSESSSEDPDGPAAGQRMLRTFWSRQDVRPVVLEFSEIEDAGLSFWTGKIRSDAVYSLTPGQLALAIRVRYRRGRGPRIVDNYVLLDNEFHVAENVCRRRYRAGHLHHRLKTERELIKAQRCPCCGWAQPCPCSGKGGPPRSTPPASDTSAPEHAKEARESPYCNVEITYDGGEPQIVQWDETVSLAAFVGMVSVLVAGKKGSPEKFFRVDEFLVCGATSQTWEVLKSVAQLHHKAKVHVCCPGGGPTAPSAQGKRPRGEEVAAGGDTAQPKRQRLWRDWLPSCFQG